MLTFSHSSELPNLKGVGHMIDVCVSGSSGGELVVVGEIFGDVAYTPAVGGGDEEVKREPHPKRHG